VAGRSGALRGQGPRAADPSPGGAGKHTIFGRVSSGIGTIDRIGRVQTDANDCPVSDVVILKAAPLS
jgi:peptidyl-prolyl cis-trans isomerase-like 1